MYLDFIKKHCKSQTYYFQIRKCENPSCGYHGSRGGDVQITEFPDPVPYDEDGVMRYTEGIDKDEKYLPSKIGDPSKADQTIPFTPTAQTAKNVGLLLNCDECSKPLLLHAKHKLQTKKLNEAKRVLNDLVFTCGSSLSELDEEGADNIVDTVYVKENLYCTQMIELPYFSCQTHQDACIRCGHSGELTKEQEHYPQCKRCTDGGTSKVWKRKHKQVSANDQQKKIPQSSSERFLVVDMVLLLCLTWFCYGTCVYDIILRSWALYILCFLLVFPFIY